jgi:serine/threonine protein kinase
MFSTGVILFIIV